MSVARTLPAGCFRVVRPDNSAGINPLGDAYRGLGDLNRAQTVYEHLATRMPDSLVSQTRLAVVYSELGDTAKARNAADTVRSITPLFSAGTFLANMPFRSEEQRESFARGLREAGLPD